MSSSVLTPVSGVAEPERRVHGGESEPEQCEESLHVEDRPSVRSQRLNGVGRTSQVWVTHRGCESLSRVR